MDKKALTAAALDDEKLLEILVPGNGARTREVRSQIRNFAGNAAARGALIVGPIGAGKSTVARVIALMRYLHLCSEEARQRIVKYLQFDGPFRIDKKSLNWFEEMNLTGLTEELAHAQLFGVAKGAATGVTERAGIFEQAMTGHLSKEDKSLASRVTGGVVLLDEIGDFSLRLQPLLLLLLSGNEVFRLGGEGNPHWGYSYNGVTIAATWKNPFDGILREDLLSRMAGYVISLPSLNDRKDEFEEIVGAIAEDITERHSQYIDRLGRESFQDISRSRLKQERERELKLNQDSIEFLRAQDWSNRGDLRGLRYTLERSFYENITVREAATSSVIIQLPTRQPAVDVAREIINEICRGENPSTMTQEIKIIERQIRERVVSLLRNDMGLRRRAADRLGVQERDLKKQLGDLIRNRARYDEDH
jgi:transcriptional regulator with AAA-type ATPase domain